jgi:hypothetical protein
MDIPLILITKFPEAEWTLSGSDYSGLEWLSEGEAPTEAELEALWPEVQYELAYEAAQKFRAQEYRETSDPLFFKYQSGEATEEEWQAARQAVREMYPYPEKMVES